MQLSSSRVSQPCQRDSRHRVHLAWPMALLHAWALLLGIGASRVRADGPVASAESAESSTTAPPAPIDPSEEVEEVVVRARRRDESLASVPLSVTVIDEAQLARSEVRTVADLGGIAPNVSIGWVGLAPSAMSLNIRGVGLKDPEKTFDPAVGLLLDGVYIGTLSGALIHNSDLESVEILRGPQGTLFGRNTTGGIVSVRRRRPTGELGLDASVTGATWGRHDYKLVGNFPIVKHQLAGKVSFYSLNQRGLFRNVATDELLPDSHNLSGIVDLLYTPSARTSVLVKYERARERAKSIPAQSASDQSDLVCFGPPLGLTSFDTPQCEDASLGKYESKSTFPGFMRFDMDAVTLQVDADLGALEVASVSGFRGHDDDSAQDFDGSVADFFSTRRTQRYDQVSEELRVQGEAFERLTYVAGLYYFYAHYDMDGTTFFLHDQPFMHAIAGPRPLGTVRVQDVGQSTHSVAGFASMDLDVVDNLRASLGGRYTHEWKRFVSDWGFSNWLDSPTARELEAADDEPAVRASESWARFTPKASLDYTLDQRLLGKDNQSMVYVSYAQGFKSGGFNGRADPATAEAYDPERVDQYEAGLKSEWLARRLFASAAVFYMDYQDKQEEMFFASDTGGQQTLTRNAASARIYGLELELSTLPLFGLSSVLGGLRVWGTLGLLEARYERFVIDFNGPTLSGVLEPKSHAGLELRDAPPMQFAVGVTSPFELQGLGRLVLNAQYRQRSRMRATYTMRGDVLTTSEVEPDGPVDSRGVMPATRIFDASLTLEVDALLGGTYRLTVFGRNMLGYMPRVAYIDVGDLFAVKAYGPPSQWGVELAASY